MNNRVRVGQLQLIQDAQALGLAILTWSPGDGWTRYRVVELATQPTFPDGAPILDYHGSSRALFTGGFAECRVFLRGYRAGRRSN